MQVTFHDKRIVMQVTLHYEAIVMLVTLHDKRIVMQVTLHYEAIVMQVVIILPPNNPPEIVPYKFDRSNLSMVKLHRLKIAQIQLVEKRKPKGHFYLEANHVVGHMNALKLHFRNNLEFDTRYFVNEFLSVKGDGTTAIYKIRVDNNVLGGLRKDVKKNQKIIVVAEENMADKKDQHKQGTSAYIQVVGKANEAREALAAAIEGIVIELRVIRERNLAEFERLYSQSVIIQPMESVIGLGGVGLGRLVLLEKDVAVEEKLVLPVDGLVLLVEEEVLGLPIEGLASKEDGLAGEEDPGLNLDNLHLLADTAIVVEEERLSLSS
nr:hypothetical protein [Tanacetum cinerariifolium]